MDVPKRLAADDEEMALALRGVAILRRLYLVELARVVQDAQAAGWQRTEIGYALEIPSESLLESELSEARKIVLRAHV